MSRICLGILLLASCATVGNRGGVGGRIDGLRARAKLQASSCGVAKDAAGALDEIEARWNDGLDAGKFAAAERRAEASLEKLEFQLEACGDVAATAPPEDRRRSVSERPAESRVRANSDRDGDGLPDSVDRCPDDREDKDGFEDTDGCPDPDNDQDGVLDSADVCLNEPEDRDGFEDSDGCPDPDNDGDGTADRDDACPSTPGRPGGNGCP